MAERPAGGKATWREMLEAYGWVLVGTTMATTVLEMAFFVTALRYGVDLEPFLRWAGGLFGVDGVAVLGTAGTFGVAYAITRLLKPFQLALVVVLTPFVARLFGVRPKAAAEPPRNPSDTPPQG